VNVPIKETLCSWHAISNLGWEKFPEEECETATGPRLETAAAFIWHSQTQVPASKFQPWRARGTEQRKTLVAIMVGQSLSSREAGSFTRVASLKATPSILNYIFIVFLFSPESN
jgi:hypothetical protein